MKKTVLILADAFRHDYLDRGVTPFLDKQKKSSHYVKKIVPGNGFCERAEIFTGKNPLDTGFFTAIDRSSSENIYKKISPLIWVFNFIIHAIPINFFEKVIRRLIWEIVSRTNQPMHPYKIPLPLLKYFSLTEDKIDMREKGALGFPSIFDHIKENGDNYFYDSFTALNLAQTGDDQYRLNLALKNASEDFSHYFIYISKLDAVGHKFGPESPEINKAISEVDERINQFITSFKEVAPETDFIILGDHGMVAVEKLLDIKTILTNVMNKYPVKLEKDYLFFLDSTLFRLWIKNSQYRERIIEELSQNSELNEYGIIINNTNSLNFNIPLHSESPDFMWWANPGVLVSPDFFHKKDENIKGMHGYINSFDSSKGFCIAIGKEWTSEVIPEEHLCSIFDKLKGNNI